MAINRVDPMTVATLEALQNIWVSELDDGANVWIDNEGTFYVLDKFSGASSSPPDVVLPNAGAAIAGFPGAAWTPLASSGGLGCDIEFAASCSGPTISQATQTSDTSTHQLSITSQAPFAAATGSNRTPGTLFLGVPAPAAGGTQGRIQIGLGGTTGFYFSKNVLGSGEFDTVHDGSHAVTFASSGAGVSGFGFILVAGSPAGVGARASGGSVTINAGDAQGNSGGSATGGDWLRTAGVGSSSGGTGGRIQDITGNGGTGNGNAGDYILVTGIPNGAGAKGKFQFYQGGLAGGLVMQIDDQSLIHVGVDANNTTVALRLNGRTQTTVGAAGGASALPATPLGYFRVQNQAGVEVEVPYYTAA